MKSTFPHISIIIPVYHEEKNIITVIKTLRKKVNTSFEAIIVYDLDTDPTVRIANKYIQKNKLVNFRLVKNALANRRGVINAIKTGIAQSKGTAVVITMADLSDDVRQIDTMYQLITKGYDIVAASRYMAGGEKIGGPFIKTWLSRTAGLTLHFMFKLPTHDATNAYKMFRRSMLSKLTIESTGGFEYSLEIVLKAHRRGYKITEIPTVWHDDPQGKSNFKLLAWLPKYIKTYLLILKNSHEQKNI